MLHRQTANAGLLALPPMTAQIATALGPALDEHRPCPLWVECVDKDVDHLNRIVLLDPVRQAFRKQRALPAIRALNKPLHAILPRSRITLRSESQPGRFYTARVISGHDGTNLRCLLYPQKRTSFATVAMSALCQ